MSDTLKDDDIKDKDEEIEDAEVDLEAASEEPDFAPTAAAPVVDDEDDLEADPHSAFDTPVESEDPHMDIYGDGGVPGEEDEEEDDYDGDSDSY
ncbi:MAG: hypothetical protein K9M11_04770 [Candidatus Pacebacteria bacterium]|nr:hypothetical protein [Candidatus Paceibacterota bacterium]